MICSAFGPRGILLALFAIMAPVSHVMAEPPSSKTSSGAPIIQSVRIEYDLLPQLLGIIGQNFRNGSDFRVMLGPHGPLKLVNVASNLLVAELPPDLKPGVYPMVIEQSSGSAKLDVAYGSFEAERTSEAPIAGKRKGQITWERPWDKHSPSD
jgi:hypothetical protein